MSAPIPSTTGDPSVCLVSGSAHYAPYRKLANALRGEGASVQLLAFERTWNPGPRFNSEFVLLGTLPLGNYLSRCWALARAIPRIRTAARESAVLYALGFDMMLLCAIAIAGFHPKPVLVYEVHDIRDILVGDGMLGPLLRRIDRALVQMSDLLVVTSRAYINHYYNTRLRLHAMRTFVLENKLVAARAPAPPHRQDANTETLRIGYFGSLRCTESLAVLRALGSRARGRVEVVLRGVPNMPGRGGDRLTGSPGVTYGGPYANPEDLPALYNSVDLVWVAGHNGKRTAKWSRTCRFYEASCFGTPMIGQRDTEDGNRIADQALGIVIDATDTGSAVEQLFAICRADIERWRAGVQALPASVHTYTDEHHQLVEQLRLLVRETTAQRRAIGLREKND